MTSEVAIFIMVSLSITLMKTAPLETIESVDVFKNLAEVTWLVPCEGFLIYLFILGGEIYTEKPWRILCKMLFQKNQPTRVAFYFSRSTYWKWTSNSGQWIMSISHYYKWQLTMWRAFVTKGMHSLSVLGKWICSGTGCTARWTKRFDQPLLSFTRNWGSCHVLPFQATFLCAGGKEKHRICSCRTQNSTSWESCFPF